MNRSITKRLTAIETHQRQRGKTFYQLCQEWGEHPENRPQLAKAAGMSCEAAAYIYSIGLSHGKPADNHFPFSAWTMEELERAIALCPAPEE